MIDWLSSKGSFHVYCCAKECSRPCAMSFNINPVIKVLRGDHTCQAIYCSQFRNRRNGIASRPATRHHMAERDNWRGLPSTSLQRCCTVIKIASSSEGSFDAEVWWRLQLITFLPVCLLLVAQIYLSLVGVSCSIPRHLDTSSPALSHPHECTN